MLIDTHCHLFSEYYDDIDFVIKNMKSNIIIVSGTNTETNKQVIKLCNKYKNVYGTLGIHPSELENFQSSDLDFITENLNNKKIVGIGEIGLDYYWTTDNKEKQKEIFEKQLQLAKKHNKTAVIHSRDALTDTYNILNKKEYSNMKIVLHCYSYDLETAQKIVKLGIKLGIGGIITFDKSKNLENVVKNIDLNHLLLETDSPYLSPVPFRGKQNKPSNVRFIAEKIAEIKNIDVEKVIKSTSDNAIRQFDIKYDL
ncbi:MAG: TatD family hydrolase [Bacilli bacterium]|nr:TatD family hydrolase [Bacilli bacterium]MDD4547285.1 TatD family hydrolase [Bacilli bacterium]